MECRLYILSILTFFALKNFCVSAEPSKRDLQLDEDADISDQLQLGEPRIPIEYGLPVVDDAEVEKRRSLMRFGKRRSLMRFGKRGSLLRFGKRGSLLRFGKKSYDDENEYLPYDLAEDDFEDDFGSYPSEKRGSLLRFGKKSSLLRFGRSAENKAPHLPWRFGRQLV